MYNTFSFKSLLFNRNLQIIFYQDIITIWFQVISIFKLSDYSLKVKPLW